MIIDVDHLNKSFGATCALVDVDLHVPAGTVQGLLGPNGAGKTTLVRILATLSAPDSGHARIGGIDVQADPITARSLVGLAGQYAAVDEALTGRENLVMIGRLYRLAKRDAKIRAEEALERLGLTAAADRPVKTYSGGMRRRLDLGASLVGRPWVLLLDEPTTGLDPATRLDLWAFIRDMVAEGTTALLTTQYLDEADELADNIVLIDHGSVIAAGTPDQLKDRLGADLLEIEVPPAELDRTVAVLTKTGSSPPQVDQGTARITLRTTSPVTELMSVVRALDSAEIVPSNLWMSHPSLDDVFLSLTGHSPNSGPRKASLPRARSSP